MKKVFTIGLLVLLAAAVKADDVKIGYINSQRIFAEYQEYQDVLAKFEKDVDGWNFQGEQMKRDIDELILELESQSLILYPEKKKEK